MKSRPRITIRDIAREAGVSTATVSRVMNSPANVALSTRELVQSVIAHHGYQSDGIAVSLASARSRTIGVVIPTITNSIYAASTQAIQAIAQAKGYTVLLGVSQFSEDMEEQLIRQLIKRRVDGLVLTGGERSRQVYKLIRDNQIPFVITWKKMDTESAMASVSFDNYEGARLAMRHLVALGHSRIALICGRSAVNDRARDRRKAYEDVMREIGSSPEKDWIHEANFDLLEGRQAMQRLLAAPIRPTAVFCANDIQAIGALFECQEQGIDVPGQISLVGFDDVPAAQYVRPQLTTIRVPAQEMGDIAARRLIAAVEEETFLTGETLPVELVVRATTRRHDAGANVAESGPREAGAG